MATPAAPTRRTPLVQRVPHVPGRRRLRVVRVDDLGPSTRRIVVGGADLETDFPFVSLASADHVRVVLPDEDNGELVLPEGTFGSLTRPDGRPVLARDYSVRAYDRAAGELSLDFVVHAHGPAGRWGARAAPGDEIGVVGPRVSQVYPAHLDHYLLIADETGLPALERFLEELPAGTRTQAYLLAPQSRTRPLAQRANGQVHWLDATTPVEATARISGILEMVPLGEGSFAWAAAEASVMRELRTRLRRHPAMTADRVAVRGYWRVGVAGPLPAP